MKINASARIGDIVKINFKTAQIFEKNGIDFCCGGGISLGEACIKQGVDIKQLILALKDVIQEPDLESRCIDEMEANELCDYIEKRHHFYIRENIPFLKQNLQKLCDVHGSIHPELHEIKILFDLTAKKLREHMNKEEELLFSKIRKMVKFKNKGKDLKNGFDDILTTINTMHKEHETEGERFEKISKLTSLYTCPSDACSTYQVTYKALKEFEKDLHRHIHLENNILFKKALILENELIK